MDDISVPCGAEKHAVLIGFCHFFNISRSQTVKLFVTEIGNASVLSLHIPEALFDGGMVKITYVKHLYLKGISFLKSETVLKKVCIGTLTVLFKPGNGGIRDHIPVEFPGHFILESGFLITCKCSGNKLCHLLPELFVIF